MRPQPQHIPMEVPSTIRGRLRFELYCLLLVFLPYEGNSDGRKLIVTLITGTSILIAILDSIGLANPPSYFRYWLIFNGLIVGRMWGIQFNNIAGVSISHDRDQRSQTSDQVDVEERNK